MQLLVVARYVSPEFESQTVSLLEPTLSNSDAMNMKQRVCLIIMHPSEEIKYIQQQEELNNVRIQTFEESIAASCLWWKEGPISITPKVLKLKPRKVVEKKATVCMFQLTDAGLEGEEGYAGIGM